MSLPGGFFLLVGLAFFLLFRRSLGHGASHGNRMADVIGKGNFAAGIKLPMLTVRGEEKEAFVFKPFLKTTGHGLLRRAAFSSAAPAAAYIERRRQAHK